MPINDDATLVIGAGNFFTGAPGTDRPLDLLDVDAPWVNLGHTSLEDIFGITSDGGEPTTLGTLQNKSLRTKYSARTETMSLTLQQFDEDSLRLFFGQNLIEVDDDFMGVPENPTPTVKAFLAVFVDAEDVFAFWAPKAEIYRADDMALSDTESYAGLPIGVKPVKYGGNAWTYAVTPLRSI